jgi:hypothetical protein
VPSARVGQIPLEVLLRRYRHVSGHFTFAEITPILDRAITYSFLRDPIDRVLSLYYFYRRQSESAGNDPRVRVAKSAGLEEFVDRLPDRVSPWSNWQTFLFSGARDCERRAEDLLPLALPNLETLDFVGTQDDLSGGLAALGRLLGQPLDALPQRVNATDGRPARDTLPRWAIAKIAALNQCDAELFQQARALAQRARHVAPGAVRTSSARARAAKSDDGRERGCKDIRIDHVAVDVSRRTITVHACSDVTAGNVTIGIRIADSVGVEIYGTNTRLLGHALDVRAGGRFEVVFHLDLPLAAGRYDVTVAIHAGADHVETCYHWIDNATHFVVSPPATRYFTGVVDLRASAAVRPLQSIETDAIR